MTSLATPRIPRFLSRAAQRIWANRWVYVFLVPTLLLFGTYTVWPMLSSLAYATLDWNGLGQRQEFVGLANFEEALSDPLFWKSLRITLVIIAVTVPIRVLAALGLALLLNNPRLPFARLFRTALFLPVVTTAAIIGIVTSLVFDPGGGPVNEFLVSTGLVDQPIDFLGSSSNALPTVMLVHTWKWLGITLIYWLAALQTVPRELYEAAQVDGAGWWRTLRSVTLPQLMPFLVIIVLLTAVETMQVFDLVQTMTGGGPFNSTLVTEVYIYQLAFASPSPRLGYASAVGVLFGLATLVLVTVQLLVVRLLRHRGRQP
ncbi:sugar ABC transporter permease [Streptomyces sp. B6B3]|uniref:carbohydrate ABC transporter permease n=1 Tax=Streptomyces sp. B6B3 TaxID=3153570 RepID=UPI00325DEF9E